MAPIEAVGDTLELIRLGTPVWLLVLFGMVAVLSGFLLWNRQGPEFGLGPTEQPVKRGHLWGVLVLTGVVLIVEMLI
ncbi:MAG: hypothetical protein R3C11_11015 [Planctomycetaceae bacterium]